MRSPLLLIPFLLVGLTLDTGCMLPNRGNDDEETSSDNSGAEEEKEVPGGTSRDDNSDNDGGADRAGGGDVRNESGTLQTGDQTLNSGEFADLYNVQVDQGETIVVEMTSSQFDPYLILRPPGGTQVDNDDFNGDRTRSRIDYVATQSGNFDVIATSYQPGESGDYGVTIEVGEGIGGGAGTGDTGAPGGK
jgi:hypothetical protein